MNERDIEVPIEGGGTTTITESDCPNCGETVPYPTEDRNGCHKCTPSIPFEEHV